MNQQIRVLSTSRSPSKRSELSSTTSQSDQTKTIQNNTYNPHNGFQQKTSLMDIDRLQQDLKQQSYKNRQKLQKIKQLDYTYSYQLCDIQTVYNKQKLGGIHIVQNLLLKQFDKLIEQQRILTKYYEKLSYKENQFNLEKQKRQNCLNDQDKIFKSIWLNDGKNDRSQNNCLNAQDRIQKMNKKVAIIKKHINQKIAQEKQLMFQHAPNYKNSQIQKEYLMHIDFIQKQKVIYKSYQKQSIQSVIGQFDRLKKQNDELKKNNLALQQKFKLQEQQKLALCQKIKQLQQIKSEQLVKSKKSEQSIKVNQTLNHNNMKIKGLQQLKQSSNKVLQKPTFSFDQTKNMLSKTKFIRIKSPIKNININEQKQQ